MRRTDRASLCWVTLCVLCECCVRCFGKRESCYVCLGIELPAPHSFQLKLLHCCTLTWTVLVKATCWVIFAEFTANILLIATFVIVVWTNFFSRLMNCKLLFLLTAVYPHGEPGFGPLIKTLKGHCKVCKVVCNCNEKYQMDLDFFIIKLALTLWKMCLLDSMPQL